MSNGKKNYDYVNTGPTILLAPLDWGLGHATRCIPLIKHLLSIGCEVLIASEGMQQRLFAQEFANVRYISLPGYHLNYGKNGLDTIIKLLLQVPKVLISISRERAWVNKFLDENKIDAIISDNRFGFFSKRIPSVFITHQLTIKTPFGKKTERWLRNINYRFIKKFSECWVPDYDGHTNLAGELSHPEHLPSIPVKYLGRLSRFHPTEVENNRNELLIVLSGPEPQRSIFENMLLEELKGNTNPAVFVRGLPGEKQILSGQRSGLIIHNHLQSEALNKLVATSKTIISRSGYSTVMDIIGLGKKCIFVPTPGQPEQLYLAQYLQGKNLCMYYSQNNFSIEKALRESMKYHPASFKGLPGNPFKKILEDFITTIRTRGK